MKFLTAGEQLDPERLPEWMQSPIMRQAMSTLSRFSEKDEDYHRYQSRQESLRMQHAIQRTLEENRVALEQSRAELEQRRVELEQRRMELEQSRVELEQRGEKIEQALALAEAERQAKEAERQAKEAERREKDAALAEVARLEALLRQRTRNPDEMP
jgi:hypothetical protein